MVRGRMDLLVERMVYGVVFLRILVNRNIQRFLQQLYNQNLDHKGLERIHLLRELKKKKFKKIILWDYQIEFKIVRIFKSRYLLQFLNGFPVNPFGQKQIGFPLSSSHNAFIPQGLGSQGFLGGRHSSKASPW